MHSEHDNGLEQQLWEYHYGLLSDEEAADVEARLASDQRLAESFEAVRQKAHVLAEAAQWEEETPQKLHPPQDAPSTSEPEGEPVSGGGREAPARQPNTTAGFPWRRAVNWAVTAAAIVLLCFTAYPLVAPSSALRSVALQRTEWRLADQFVQLEVAGPVSPVENTPQRYRVQARDLQNDPRTTPVQLQVLDADDRVAHRQQRKTDQHGEVWFDIPAEVVRPGFHLEVVPEDEPTYPVSLPLEPQPSRYATRLITDRNQYAPGDVVHFRSVTLNQFSLEPDREFELEIAVHTRDGSSISPGPQRNQRTSTVNGVAAGSIELPEEIPSGEFALSARSIRDGRVHASRAVHVEETDPPIQLDVVFHKLAYQPQDVVTGDVLVRNSEGEPLAGGNLTLTLETVGTTTPPPTNLFHTTTDDDGTARFQFLAISELADRDQIAITVESGDIRRVFTEPIPAVRPDVQLHVFPEAGDLVGGLPQRLYIQASDGEGRGRQIQGQFLDAAETVLATITTDHRGQAVAHLTPPEHSSAISFAVVQPEGLDLSRSLDVSAGTPRATMRIDDSVLEPDQDLTVDVVSRGGATPLMLTANCRGVLVGQQRIARRSGQGSTPSERADDPVVEEPVSVKLAQEAGGVIRVTLYDDRSSPPLPLAERLVYRRPGRSLAVSVDVPSGWELTESSELAARISASDENQQPAEANLGLAIVEEPLLANFNSPTGFLESFLLATDVRTGQDLELAGYLPVEPNAAAEQRLDFLLATAGWRTFLRPTDRHDPQNDFAQTDPNILFTTAVTTSDGPHVVNNHPDVERAFRGAVLAFYNAREQQLQRVGQLSLAGVMILGLVLIFLALFRLVSRPWLITSVALTSVCLLGGMIWWGAKVEPDGQVVFHTFPSLTRAPRGVALNEQESERSTSSDEKKSGAAVEMAMDAEEASNSASEEAESSPADASSTSESFAYGDDAYDRQNLDRFDQGETGPPNSRDMPLADAAPLASEPELRQLSNELPRKSRPAAKADDRRRLSKDREAATPGIASKSGTGTSGKADAAEKAQGPTAGPTEPQASSPQLAQSRARSVPPSAEEAQAGARPVEGNGNQKSPAAGNTPAQEAKKPPEDDRARPAQATRPATQEGLDRRQKKSLDDGLQRRGRTQDRIARSERQLEAAPGQPLEEERADKSKNATHSNSNGTLQSRMAPSGMSAPEANYSNVEIRKFPKLANVPRQPSASKHYFFTPLIPQSHSSETGTLELRALEGFSDSRRGLHYWSAAARTDPVTGELSVDFELPLGTGTYGLYAEAHDRDGRLAAVQRIVRNTREPQTAPALADSARPDSSLAFRNLQADESLQEGSGDPLLRALTFLTRNAASRLQDESPARRTRRRLDSSEEAVSAAFANAGVLSAAGSSGDVSAEQTWQARHFLDAYMASAETHAEPPTARPSPPGGEERDQAIEEQASEIESLGTSRFDATDLAFELLMLHRLESLGVSVSQRTRQVQAALKQLEPPEKGKTSSTSIVEKFSISSERQRVAEPAEAWQVWYELERRGLASAPADSRPDSPPSPEDSNPRLLALEILAAQADSNRQAVVGKRLLELQAKDGSFSTARSGDDAPRADAVETTALVLLALRQFSDSSDATAQAIAWLKQQQQPGGGFGNSRTTALAIDALLQASAAANGKRP